MHTATALLLVAGLAESAMAQYAVQDNYTGDNFYNMFDFWTGADPTNGFVSYGSSAASHSAGLVNITAQGQAYIGVDYKTNLTVSGGAGRKSVRLTSKATYQHYLAVLDLAHMPGGICGTWPAFWSFGSQGAGWPTQGEIDIIEGVNDQKANFMTLHSSPKCSIANSSQSVLQPVGMDCNTQANGNEGCGYHSADTSSYGKGFNKQGGGVYATEWTSKGVSVWYWPRGTEPPNAFEANPDPTTWGKPTGAWAGNGCDWDAHFIKHNLVFDTTFCGSWGGADSAFASCKASTGAATCQAFVANNPAAFREAYWLVNALVVYTNNAANSTMFSGTPKNSALKGAAAPIAGSNGLAANNEDVSNVVPPNAGQPGTVQNNVTPNVAAAPLAASKGTHAKFVPAQRRYVAADMRMGERRMARGQN